MPKKPVPSQETKFALRTARVRLPDCTHSDRTHRRPEFPAPEPRAHKQPSRIACRTLANSTTMLRPAAKSLLWCSAGRRSPADGLRGFGRSPARASKRLLARLGPGCLWGARRPARPEASKSRDVGRVYAGSPGLGSPGLLDTSVQWQRSEDRGSLPPTPYGPSRRPSERPLRRSPRPTVALPSVGQGRGSDPELDPLGGIPTAETPQAPGLGCRVALDRLPTRSLAPEHVDLLAGSRSSRWHPALSFSIA